MSDPFQQLTGFVPTDETRPISVYPVKTRHAAHTLNTITIRISLLW